MLRLRCFKILNKIKNMVTKIIGSQWEEEIGEIPDLKEKQEKSWEVWEVLSWVKWSVWDIIWNTEELSKNDQDRISLHAKFLESENKDKKEYIENLKKQIEIELKKEIVYSERHFGFKALLSTIKQLINDVLKDNKVSWVDLIKIIQEIINENYPTLTDPEKNQNFIPMDKFTKSKTSNKIFDELFDSFPDPKEFVEFFRKPEIDRAIKTLESNLNWLYLDNLISIYEKQRDDVYNRVYAYISNSLSDNIYALENGILKNPEYKNKTLNEVSDAIREYLI